MRNNINQNIQSMYEEEDNIDLQNAILASMNTNTESSEIENTRQLHTTSIYNELDTDSDDDID